MSKLTPTQFRYIASVLSVVSYLLLVIDHRPVGVTLNLLSQGLLVPFAYKVRAWDMIGLSGIFGGISLHYLITLML